MNNRKHSSILKSLLRKPCNNLCADCETKGPTWASATIGVFVCIRCSGIHRKLGTHISFVRSVNLDSWKYHHVQNMMRVGNKVANELYEFHKPQSIQKPTRNTPIEILEDYIQKKYAQKKWMKNTIHSEPVKPKPVDFKFSKPNERKVNYNTPKRQTIISLKTSSSSSRKKRKENIKKTPLPYNSNNSYRNKTKSKSKSVKKLFTRKRKKSHDDSPPLLVFDDSQKEDNLDLMMENLFSTSNNNDFNNNNNSVINVYSNGNKYEESVGLRSPNFNSGESREQRIMKMFDQRIKMSSYGLPVVGSSNSELLQSQHYRNNGGMYYNNRKNRNSQTNQPLMMNQSNSNDILGYSSNDGCYTRKTYGRSFF